MPDEPPQFDAVVIGAGFAGLSAAARLADHGLRVAVFEQAPRLGGRASAFTDKVTGERVDNGQHVLFGCYHDTYAFLRLVGAEDLAPLQRRLELPMVDSSGRIRALRCPDLPPPWNLLAGLMGWGALSFTDRLATLRVGRVIAQARRLGVDAVVAAVPSNQTVDGWLDQLRQPRAARDWLWHPLTLAALNQSADCAAAAPFVRVVAQLFGPAPEDSAVGLARVPLDELYAEPARRFIEARGGIVRLKSPAQVILDSDGTVTGVRTPDGIVSCRAVVSAVAWPAFRNLWDGVVPPVVAAIAQSAAAMENSPIVTVNLWFDGPVMDQQFIGLVDAPIHWVFNKSAILRDEAAHLAVVTSGADALASSNNDTVTRLTVSHLERVLPRVRGRALLRSVVVREQRATFSLAPGGPMRPAQATAVPGFWVAGDWTDTGLPATIEGAVVSGHRAADLVLAGTRRQVPARGA
jgi:squalene-associated FAD-dependent desaturase